MAKKSYDLAHTKWMLKTEKSEEGIMKHVIEACYPHGVFDRTLYLRYNHHIKVS